MKKLVLTSGGKCKNKTDSPLDVATFSFHLAGEELISISERHLTAVSQEYIIFWVKNTVNKISS